MKAAGHFAGEAGAVTSHDQRGELPLTRSGQPTSQADTPAGGSKLSMRFAGDAHYTASGESLYQGIEFDNFELSFDVKPTAASPALQIAIALGRYGAGADFIYLTEGSWRYNVNGAGDQITGAAGSATLDQWQTIRFIRKDGVCELYVNDKRIGTSTVFQNPSNDLRIGAGTRADGGPDLPFTGLIDNVRIASDHSGGGTKALK